MTFGVGGCPAGHRIRPHPPGGPRRGTEPDDPTGAPGWPNPKDGPGGGYCTVGAVPSLVLPGLSVGGVGAKRLPALWRCALRIRSSSFPFGPKSFTAFARRDWRPSLPTTDDRDPVVRWRRRARNSLHGCQRAAIQSRSGSGSRPSSSAFAAASSVRSATASPACSRRDRRRVANRAPCRWRRLVRRGITQSALRTPLDHGVRVRENSVATLALKSAARLGLALLVLVAACSGDGPSSPVPANEVRVSNNAFSPASRTIAVGTTLTWRWVSGSSTHNVTFSGGPASPDQASGTFARLFSAAGTFAYQCTIHGGSMSGSVTVQ